MSISHFYKTSTLHFADLDETRLQIAAPAEAVIDDVRKHPGLVKSPIVGTAYLTPEPGAAPFVSVGASVKAGDTVVCFGDSLTFGSGVKGAGTTEGEAYPAVLRRLFEQRGRTAPGTP